MTEKEEKLLEDVKNLVARLLAATREAQPSKEAFGLKTFIKLCSKAKLEPNLMAKILIFFEGRHLAGDDPELISIFKETPGLRVIDSEENFKSGKASNKLFSEVEAQKLILLGWLEDFEGKLICTQKIKDLLLTKEIAAQEIYNIYPYSTGETNQYHLKFLDKAEFTRIYVNLVGDGKMIDKDVHDELYLDILFAKEQKLIFPNMQTFVNQFDIWKRRWHEARISFEGTFETNNPSITSHNYLESLRTLDINNL